MELTESEVSNVLLCKHCQSTLQVRDKFCGSCGNPVEETIHSHVQADVFERLRPVLVYYFITLILLSVFKFTNLFPDGFQGMCIISLLDIAVTIIFWVDNRKEVASLFSFKNVQLKIVALTMVGALIGSAAIFFIADIIQVSISDDVFYDLYLFEDTSFPMMMAILFICVQPAIFEEVTFRGFLFNHLQGITSPIGTVYITSFIFGIIHLALISMLWLVPIGLAFAFLRVRYNTLWYGVIGHFTYNLGIVLLEFF